MDLYSQRKRGYGEEVLYDASLSALQLNRKQQTIYNYKTNNTGRDMQSEQEVLAAGNSFDRITDDGAPSFLPLPGITMLYPANGCCSTTPIRPLPTDFTD